MSLPRLTVVRLPALAAVALALGACSSAPAGGGSMTMPGPASVTTDTLTVSCNVKSGFPGDDLCILPPDPAQGFQFHFGPKDYNDKTEVGRYLLQPGEEKTECVFTPGSNTKTAYIMEYHSRLRPGSHHLLNYVQPTANGAAPRTSIGPEPCNQNQNFRMLFGATSAVMDVARASPGAENEGVAVQLDAKQQVVLQLHVINASSAPILREAWANFRYADPRTVTELADPIQFTAGVVSNIPVGTSVINRGSASVPSSAAPDFRLVAAIPHYHAHTTKFVAYKTINGKRELLLAQYNTLGHVAEPTLVAFDSATQNPVADDTTQTDGAFTGIVHMAPGDTIDWECTQTNDGIGPNGTTFTTSLQFTEQVYTGEMCNLFGLYAPTTGGSWSGFGLTQTVVPYLGK
jgi:hypothetical protein